MTRFVHLGMDSFVLVHSPWMLGRRCYEPGRRDGCRGRERVGGSSTPAGGGGGQEVAPGTGMAVEPRWAAVLAQAVRVLMPEEKAGSSGGAAGATGRATRVPLADPFLCRARLIVRQPRGRLPIVGNSSLLLTLSIPAAIATDPFATGTIWMNARSDSGTGQKGNGGLFKSTDCGSAGSWIWVTDPTKNDPTSANMINGMWTWSMAMDYLTRAQSYLQDNYPSACGATNCPAPQGVSKSTDFGKTWTKILAPNHFPFLNMLGESPAENQRRFLTSQVSPWIQRIRYIWSLSP